MIEALDVKAARRRGGQADRLGLPALLELDEEKVLSELCLGYRKRDHFVAQFLRQFEQTNTSPGHEFSELKSYLLARVLWNPDADADAVIDEFLAGYYGAAAPWSRRWRMFSTNGERTRPSCRIHRHCVERGMDRPLRRTMSSSR